MGARDSDDDIRNYLPDLSTIMRKADPAYGEKILREAMDNPELDAALAERRKETSDGGDPAESAGKAPEAAKAGANAPSPWAKASSEEPIDRAALPSASAPKAQAAAVEPNGTSPIKILSEKGARPQGRRTLPLWLFVVAATVALVSPIAMWLISSKLPPRAVPEAPGPTAASGQPALPPVTLDGGAAPNIENSAPASSSAAPPVVTGSSTQEPLNPVPKETGERPMIKSKGRTDDASGNAGAPSLPKTARPIPTAAPVATDIMQ